jgi:hypothetical protein
VEADDPLGGLAGGHLDTVSFVMDYVEFRIGYNTLRALSPPNVTLHDGTTATFPEPGSRDALCQLIDIEVAEARIARGDRASRIEVRTSRGDVLTIALDAAKSPESAHLVPADEQGHLLVEDMHIW